MNRSAADHRFSSRTSPGIGPRALLAAGVALSLLSCSARSAPDHPVLTLERSIALAGVKGRIDHLTVDTTHGRLFVAELGNGSVEAIDLTSGRSLGRIAGLSEPQGLGYLAQRDELAVATGGDGMLRFYSAGDLRLAGEVKLGADADNVRIDESTGRVVVGFGAGALAVVDPATRQVVGKVPLPEHPEGFQLGGGRAYVNVPGARVVQVAELAAGKPLATWSNGWLNANYAMALDAQAARLAVVYRLPPVLAILDTAHGDRRQTLSTCGDADDVAFDHRRGRIYVVCGAGAVDVFAAAAKGYVRLDRVTSRDGARTGLFAPQLDRLFVAARATDSSDAAIFVYRPN